MGVAGIILVGLFFLLFVINDLVRIYRIERFYHVHVYKITLFLGSRCCDGTDWLSFEEVGLETGGKSPEDPVGQ
jgi:hypothetical protein